MFSLILTYRNREDFLPRTLHSLLQAMQRPLQVILVDNGSTDSSAEICRNFQRRHSSDNFQILNISEPRHGASLARNAGLAQATSPYVYFFDSDDRLSPYFLTDVEKTLARLSPLGNTDGAIQPDIVAAPSRMVFEDGSTRVRYYNTKNKLTDQILTGMLSTQSMVLRREFLIAAGGWNEQLPKWNDWELGIRLMLNGARIVWLENPYHQIYQHPRSLTAMPRAEAFSAESTALRAASRLVRGMSDAEKALAVRAFVLSREARRCGECALARSLQREFPLPSPMRWLLQLHARIYNKGIWRTARMLL